MNHPAVPRLVRCLLETAVIHFKRKRYSASRCNRRGTLDEADLERIHGSRGLNEPHALSGLSTAQEAFKGKTINIVVGYSAGGGYDQYARALARHMGAHIPGQPNIVVQNLPARRAFSPFGILIQIPRKTARSSRHSTPDLSQRI